MFQKAQVIFGKKILAVTTDGRPSMTGTHNGSVALLQACVPNVFGVNSIIHQEVFCAKLDKGDRLKAVMDKMIQIVNFIHARPLHHYQFVVLMDQIETEYRDLHRLSRGKVLDCFLAELKDEN